MVLKKITNKGEKDICLPWGQFTYKLPVGGVIENPPAAVITALLERYQGLEVEDYTVEDVVPVEVMAEIEHKRKVAQDALDKLNPKKEVKVEEVKGEEVKPVVTKVDAPQIVKKAGRPKKGSDAVVA
jgi:hypothetical protein